MLHLTPRSIRLSAVVFLCFGTLANSSRAENKVHPTETPDAAVSYFKDIRPIFQANCQGRPSQPFSPP